MAMLYASSYAIYICFKFDVANGMIVILGGTLPDFRSTQGMLMLPASMLLLLMQVLMPEPCTQEGCRCSMTIMTADLASILLQLELTHESCDMLDHALLCPYSASENGAAKFT